ncbi:accessory gene regulator ArgB-like protein [Alkaliphilus peptidifermentans]|uniref:Accessory gene regulator B n=1 Tax=Alkaliphilus peptidifermentans DSM 18978 TaxID=1120976 RepID=A0A1G5KT93_9FIRM|nr:accessory gene regulator B family protein [Alkaliphilus peptidifermentans]SCZ03320.1 accessory gene regulator B [Alkaliphilus peptidifermentans DSM 18978]
MNKAFTIDYYINKVLDFFKGYMDIDKKQNAVLSYAIRLVINSIIAYSMALIPALIFGNFNNVLIITLTFAALRVFSGGAHNSSILNCSINGAIISNILGFLPKYLVLNKSIMFSIIIFTFLFSLWAIGKYAPADTPSKPITTKAKRQVLRRNSFVVVCIWCFISIVWFIKASHVTTYIYASTLGILWQSFTVTTSGYKLYSVADKALLYFRREEI